METQSGPKRLFINEVDKYSSKSIAKFLAAIVARDDAEDLDDDEPLSSFRGEPVFNVVGTLSGHTKEKVGNFLFEYYTSPTREELFERLMECDVVVYNISESTMQEQIDEATWAFSALTDEMDNFKSKKMFILISTLMTWAMTRPQDPDDIDLIFREEDFRRRRPHPRFKYHNELEKLVLKLSKIKKSKLVGYVVASGLQYGLGENLFHFFFKVSWLMQFPRVPLFGEGTNFVPMIHVHDLAGAIQKIIELKPKSKYIVAVDDAKNTLEEVVKEVSHVLGPGKVNKLQENKALTMKAFEPDELIFLRINLCVDTLTIKELNLRWKSEAGIVENMESVVEEYRNTRQLLPIRICLIGPPAVGKSTIAKRLCSHYQIHHITVKDIIDEKFAQLEEIIKGTDPESFGEEVAAAKRTQENLNRSMRMNDGRLSDSLVFEIVQEKLNSKSCRNQGFVLEGFPKTYEQAKQIFRDEEVEEDEYSLKKPVCNTKITPDHVISLDAPDDVLKKRAQALPERVAEKMRCTEAEYLPRLEKFRNAMAAEESVLDYFDELEIHPKHIEVGGPEAKYTELLKEITEVVGVPKNYGLSEEDQNELDRRKEEERRQKLAAQAAEKKRKNEATLAEMATHYSRWQENLAELNRQEMELLEARSLPLRNYLMKYVVPSLTDAILDCCKIKVEDPVDFLAEYLLRNNQ